MKIEEYARWKLAQYQTVVNDRDLFYFLSGIRIALKAAYKHIDAFPLKDFLGTEQERDHAIAVLSVLATEIEEIAEGERDLPEVGE